MGTISLTNDGADSARRADADAKRAVAVRRARITSILACSALWEWAVRFFWSDPLSRCQCESVGARFVMGPLPYINGVGRIVLGDRVTFGGKPDFFFGNRSGGIPELVIGDRVFIGHQ